MKPLMIGCAFAPAWTPSSCGFCARAPMQRTIRNVIPSARRMGYRIRCRNSSASVFKPGRALRDRVERVIDAHVARDRGKRIGRHTGAGRTVGKPGPGLDQHEGRRHADAEPIEGLRVDLELDGGVADELLHARRRLPNRSVLQAAQHQHGVAASSLVDEQAQRRLGHAQGDEHQQRRRVGDPCTGAECLPVRLITRARAPRRRRGPWVAVSRRH